MWRTYLSHCLTGGNLWDCWTSGMDGWQKDEWGNDQVSDLLNKCMFVRRRQGNVCKNVCVCVCVTECTNNHEWSWITRDSGTGSSSPCMNPWQLTAGTEALETGMYKNQAAPKTTSQSQQTKLSTDQRQLETFFMAPPYVLPLPRTQHPQLIGAEGNKRRGEHDWEGAASLL